MDINAVIDQQMGAQPPEAAPAKTGIKNPAFARLAALIPIALAKGGRAGVAGLIQGYQQGLIRKQQMAQQQQALGFNQQQALAQGQRADRQLGLQEQQVARAQEQDALRAKELERARFLEQAQAMGAMDQSPEAAMQALSALAPQASAVGVPQVALESQFAVTPSAAQARKFRGILDRVDREWKGKADPEQIEGMAINDPAAQGMTVGQIRAALSGVTPGAAAPVAAKGASDFDRHLQRHYAAVKAKIGRDLTPDEMVSEELVAKRKYAQADDKGPDPTLQAIRELTLQQQRQLAQTGGLLPAQFGQAQALANDFQQETKDFWTQRNAYQRVVSSNPSQDSPAGHMALIFAYMKLLDPNSVVRETEYANAQNASAIPDRIRNLYNATVEGAILTPRQIADFKQQARAIYAGAKTGALQVKSIYDQRAAAQGLPAPSVTYMLPDPEPTTGASLPNNESAAGAPKTQIGPSIGERRQINGRLGEWDGKGWKPVSPSAIRPRPSH